MGEVGKNGVDEVGGELESYLYMRPNLFQINKYDTGIFVLFEIYHGVL